MDVSVIIVNYNTLQLTLNCINSIVNKTVGINYEIILVDNASTDGSKECFERDNRVTYIYSKKNGGFGYGNNLGMKVAIGKYFFLLNSDTLLVNNAIKEFYEYAEAHNPKTIYGCYLQGEDGSYRMSFFDFPAFTITEFLLRRFHIRHGYKVDFSIKNVDAITGADMFLPRDAIADVGMFDENIFMYGEEGEWQYRMKQKGYARVIITSPKIIHLEGESTKKSNYIRTIDGHFYTLRKHMPRWKYLLARAYYAIIQYIIH